MWLPQSSTQSNQVALVEKNPSANAGDIRDCRFDPWVRTIPRKRAWHGNPLQYSCLENPMDRGAWRAPVHRVAKSRTRLSLHAHPYGPSQEGTIGHCGLETPLFSPLPVERGSTIRGGLRGRGRTSVPSDLAPGAGPHADVAQSWGDHTG